MQIKVKMFFTLPFEVISMKYIKAGKSGDYMK